ncbi:hypothetical protein Hjap01_04358 [Haloarcula japonica]
MSKTGRRKSVGFERREYFGDAFDVDFEPVRCFEFLAVVFLRVVTEGGHVVNTWYLWYDMIQQPFQKTTSKYFLLSFCPVRGIFTEWVSPIRWVFKSCVAMTAVHFV